MSVGTGSIKRAAKAVKNEKNANPAEEVKAVVEKSTATKAEAPKATKKPVAKKTTTKTETKAVEKKVYNSNYVAYGIGQQLPVHLM